eukprot:s102_g8.t1
MQVEPSEVASCDVVAPDESRASDAHAWPLITAMRTECRRPQPLMRIQICGQSRDTASASVAARSMLPGSDVQRGKLSCVQRAASGSNNCLAPRNSYCLGDECCPDQSLCPSAPYYSNKICKHPKKVACRGTDGDNPAEEKEKEEDKEQPKDRDSSLEASALSAECCTSRRGANASLEVPCDAPIRRTSARKASAAPMARCVPLHPTLGQSARSRKRMTAQDGMPFAGLGLNAPKPLKLPEFCEVGQSVPCPNSNLHCAGSLCCPDGSPCPSAPNSAVCWKKEKVGDCTVQAPVEPPKLEHKELLFCEFNAFGSKSKLVMMASMSISARSPSLRTSAHGKARRMTRSLPEKPPKRTWMVQRTRLPELGSGSGGGACHGPMMPEDGDDLEHEQVEQEEVTDEDDEEDKVEEEPTPDESEEEDEEAHGVKCPDGKAVCSGISCCPDGSLCPSAPLLAPGTSGCPHPKKLDCTCMEAPKIVGKATCSVGASVPCPGHEHVMCAGLDCCPDGSTCPSALVGTTHCQKAKVHDCTGQTLETEMKAEKPMVFLKRFNHEVSDAKVAWLWTAIPTAACALLLLAACSVVAQARRFKPAPHVQVDDSSSSEGTGFHHVAFETGGDGMDAAPWLSQVQEELAKEGALPLDGTSLVNAIACLRPPKIRLEARRERAAKGMSQNAVPYIGRKISLVSNSELRYEGILYTINTQEVSLPRGHGMQGLRIHGSLDSGVQFAIEA